MWIEHLFHENSIISINKYSFIKSFFEIYIDDMKNIAIDSGQLQTVCNSGILEIR